MVAAPAAAELAPESEAPEEAEPQPPAGEAVVLATFPILSAFPHDADRSVRVELGLLIKDLRRARRWIEARRTTQKQSRLGAIFLAPGAQRDALGFDLLVEMTRLIELAAPERGGKQRIVAAADPWPPPALEPIPAAIVGFTMAEGAGFQGIMGVEPGFLERVAAALASSDPPAWGGEVVEGGLEIPVGDRRLRGRVGDDGWLRLAFDQAMLTGPVAPDPDPFFSSSLRPWAEAGDSLLFIRGGGLAAVGLSAVVDQPLLREVLADMRLAALTWQFDGDRTSAVRLLIDTPTFETLRLKLRRADITADLLELWDPDVTQFLSLSIPPVLREPLAHWVEDRVAETGDELPAELAKALETLDGRVGFAAFGSPGDWAVGVRLADPDTAASVLPSLHEWFPRLAEQAGLTGPRLHLPVRETVSGARVLHAQPDPDLEGLRFTAVGSTVVGVTQRQRLVTLLDHARSRRQEPQAGLAISRLLTPMVKTAVETPAMIQGYTVLSDTGELFRYAAMALGVLKERWSAAVAADPNFAIFSGFLARAPTILALEGFHWTMLYDLALTADFDGSVLVIQLIASEV